MGKTAKTNAARLLDAADVTYEIRTYDLTMAEFSAAAVARQIGLPAAMVFKTLVAEIDGAAPCFAVVPGDTELDLKALAKAAGGRRAAMAPLKDVQRLTGYLRGAVTVLAAKKTLATYVDRSVHDFDEIAVSAGARGVQLVLSTRDYLQLTSAETAPIAKQADGRMA